jgi:hypothetical protein
VLIEYTNMCPNVCLVIDITSKTGYGITNASYKYNVSICYYRNSTTTTGPGTNVKSLRQKVHAANYRPGTKGYLVLFLIFLLIFLQMIVL